LQFLDLSADSLITGRFTLRQVEERTPLLGPILELLRHADLGVTGAGVVERPPPTRELQRIAAGLGPEFRDRLTRERWTQAELTHRGSGEVEVALPWPSESAGTHRLFALAGPWLDILDNGYTVCVDELETSMHPLMARELLRLIFSKKENSKGAQILFTTHNPLLLDATLLRRDQVWFTEKDQQGEAHLYPLTDYSPRKGESLVRGYLSGRYGAVPFVPEGLLGSFKPHEIVSAPEGESHE
jgi:hypothetical protein